MWWAKGTKLFKYYSQYQFFSISFVFELSFLMLTLLCGMIFLNKLEQYLFTDFFYYFCIGIIWYQYGMILILKHASQKIRAELKPLSLSLSVVLIQCNLREKQFIILYLDKYTSPYTYTIVTNFNYTAFALRMLFEKYNWGHAP